MSLRVLSCDTGLATFGWALCEYVLAGALPAHVEVVLLDAGALATEPSAKKRKVRSVEDTARRLGEIAEVLRRPCLNDPSLPVRVLCVESLSNVRNAGSSAKMGSAWGLVLGYALLRRIPILQATPQAVKLAATGQKKATKDEMIDAMIRLHPELAELLTGVPDTLHEHAADALAVAHACKNDESVLMALAMQEALLQ